MEHTVVIHPSEEGGFWTEVPALPGCGSQGETIEEAGRMTKGAIEGFPAYLREKGQEIPQERVGKGVGGSLAPPPTQPSAHARRLGRSHRPSLIAARTAWR